MTSLRVRRRNALEAEEPVSLSYASCHRAVFLVSVPLLVTVSFSLWVWSPASFHFISRKRALSENLFKKVIKIPVKRTDLFCSQETNRHRIVDVWNLTHSSQQPSGIRLLLYDQDLLGFPFTGSGWLGLWENGVNIILFILHTSDGLKGTGDFHVDWENLTNSGQHR